MTQFFTKENKAVMQSDRQPVIRWKSLFRRKAGGILIQSAEGTRLSYSSTQLPGFIGNIALDVPEVSTELDSSIPPPIQDQTLEDLSSQVLP